MEVNDDFSNKESGNSSKDDILIKKDISGKQRLEIKPAHKRIQSTDSFNMTP